MSLDQDSNFAIWDIGLSKLNQRSFVPAAQALVFDSVIEKVFVYGTNIRVFNY
jgi:hypothetical protein